MGVIGGSRHYVGGGLGNESGWKCPSCGAENAGPIARGCQLCGAGAPGTRLDSPPPPAPPSRSPAPSMGVPAVHPWLDAHPDATLEQAFTAGYIEGVRDARRQLAEQSRPEPALAPALKVTRTLVAALEYFADQVLRGQPEEVQSGEWCSADEVRALVEQLRQGELTHA